MGGLVRARRLAAVSRACLCFALVGCQSSAVLVVDLRTDYVGGRDFTSVRTEILGPEGMPPVRSSEHTAAAGQDYLAGVRVAEIDALAPGLTQVRVSLRGREGMLAERLVIVQVRGPTALVVTIASSCRRVVCPGDGDDPALTTCVGGRCVDPRCSPHAPEHCPPPTCTTDAACKASSECARPVCVAGECFVAVDDRACPAGTYCHPNDGCVRVVVEDGGVARDAGPNDAAPRDGPPGEDAPACPRVENDCGNGIDDDCDGTADCGDGDCEGVACDDGQSCTEADRCTAGLCAGSPRVCDDGNPCTDDACDPASGCVHSPNSAPCDDGVWCNGSDTCVAGSCSAHAGSPCPAYCNEAARACEQCRSDGDCGSVSYGPWSSCGAFSDTCDETGTQTRSVTTPRCVSNSCTTTTSSESRSCTRDTDGTSCGTTSYGSWSACAGFSDVCDETGTRSRSVTQYQCVSGSCTASTSMESSSCTRDTDGTNCGGSAMCPFRCTAGICDAVCLPGCPC